MRGFILVCAFLLSPLASAANTCLDISGKYSSPLNTQSEKTTLIYTQSGCERLTVSGIHVSNPGGVLVLPTGHYSLEGGRPKNCQFGFHNTCASYSAASSEITKVLVTQAMADGGTHGVCEYTKSFLRKDARGNLIETVTDAWCEDGYKGVLEPLVFSRLE